jgi:hypothetical protein
MTTTVTKLYPTGLFRSSVEFDEITYSSVKISTTGVYASGFDEVTYNTTSNVVKNLLSWSEYYTAWSSGDQSGWFYNASPNQITFNATAGPVPGTLAGKLIDMPASLGSQIHRIYCNWAQFVTGRVYTLSIYAKSAERTQFILFHEETAGRVGINVDLATGTTSNYSIAPTSSFITSVGNGWYRVGFTFTATQTGSSVLDLCRMKNGAGNATYIGDGTSGMYLWGAQLEESPVATLYQGNGASATPYVAGNKATPLVPTFARRDASTGELYVTGQFDEYTLSFIQADGGTTSTYSLSGTNYKTHTFTSNSTFTIASAGTVDLLLVGGGGGGTVGYYGGGGFHSPGVGGNGGYGLTTSTYLAAGTYAIVVGTGGTFGYSGAVPNGGPGGSTTAFGFTAAGGTGGVLLFTSAGNTNGPVSSIAGSSYQYGQGGPITTGMSAGVGGAPGTGNGGAGGGDGNFPGGQGGLGVVIVRYVTS